MASEVEMMFVDEAKAIGWEWDPRWRVWKRDEDGAFIRLGCVGWEYENATGDVGRAPGSVSLLEQMKRINEQFPVVVLNWSPIWSRSESRHGERWERSDGAWVELTSLGWAAGLAGVGQKWSAGRAVTSQEMLEFVDNQIHWMTKTDAQ